MADEPAPLAMQIDVVEYLGTESQVVGHAAGAADAKPQRLTVTVPGDAHGLLHQRIGLAADPADLHLFDTASGVALRP